MMRRWVDQIELLICWPMISFGVIKDKTKSSRCQDLTRTITKPTPALCVVAPPKVAIRKTFLSHPRQPSSPQLTQPYMIMATETPASRQQGVLNDSIQLQLVDKPERAFRQPTGLTQNTHQYRKEGIEWPQQNIHTLKSNQRLRGFSQINKKSPEKVEPARSFISFRSPILTQYLQDAKDQFEFTKKGKTHHMPRDNTYSLTIFTIPSLPPFQI